LFQDNHLTEFFFFHLQAKYFYPLIAFLHST
jgi:hypothetical protein